MALTEIMDLENYEYLSTKELSETESNLIEEAKIASKSSYSPYSNFQVGAAVLLDNESNWTLKLKLLQSPVTLLILISR